MTVCLVNNCNRWSVGAWCTVSALEVHGLWIADPTLLQLEWEVNKSAVFFDILYMLSVSAIL